MSAQPFEVKPLSASQIKVPKVNGGRYTLADNIENKTQQFQVVRLIGPEDAKEVNLAARWGSTRIGIQLLGVFPTEKEAQDYVNTIYHPCENWSDYYVVAMWEWIEIPPSDVPPVSTDEMQVHRPKQPLLDAYMQGLQRNQIERAQIMQLRREMAKEVDDDVNDILLEDQKMYTLEVREKQLQDIVKNPDNYPENMKEFAAKKLVEVQKEIENLRSREKIKDLVGKIKNEQE